tara:strand:+ start:535 stop:819 length:285 start_codon:yes stop_codon:yes gene_type:complete
VGVVAIPVRAEPSIAGKAPVKLAEVRLVRAAPLIAGRFPVRLAEVRLVKAEPSPAKDVAVTVPVTPIPLGKLGAPVPASSEIVSTFMVLMWGTP